MPFLRARRSRCRADRGKTRLRAALVGLLGLLVLSGCGAAAHDPPAVRATALAPTGAQRAALDRLGPLRFAAGYVLGSADPRFGGLSGLWLAPDGSRLIAASDRGTLWTASLDHAADGRLIGLRDWQAVEPGRAPGDGGRQRDAESLATDGDGGLVVAYEGAHRLRRLTLADLAAPATPLPTPAMLAKPGNAGIEALVDLPGGGLLALAEGVFTAAGDLAGWLIEGGRVEPLSYAASGGFVPTGADRLDEVIYVVERRFSLLGGFASRIVTLDAATVRPGARLSGRVLGELRAPAVAENFEGIAVRAGPDRRVLVYLLADDNFTVLQRTLLLQFSLALD